MSEKVTRIAVTGGAGQIAYSLLFRLAHGDLFGSHIPIALHILDLEEQQKALEGIKMELEDCAFPLLREIRIGSDAQRVFEGVEWAFLVGSKPRGPGMERKDLLAENGKIFIEQGRALNLTADRNVKVLVIGNPCNTNCLIAMHHAPNLAREHFHAMTRLDQNRATNLLAQKAHCSIDKVSCVTIWGNHSSTQVPDYIHAHINDRPVVEMISDKDWLENSFIPLVQKRGAAIIEARGKSSAASAANAAVDAMKAIAFPTAAHSWFSSAVSSENNPYGIDPDLVFSFPCRVTEKGDWEIVRGLEWDAALKTRIQITEKELIEERNLVEHLLG